MSEQRPDLILGALIVGAVLTAFFLIASVAATVLGWMP